MIVLEPHGRSSKEVPVSIVGGLDVHRRQITFDWVDWATGQAQRGQITPATRQGLGRWLAQLPGHHGAFAVEACTGWRLVVEELQAAGSQRPHQAPEQDHRGERVREGSASAPRLPPDTSMIQDCNMRDTQASRSSADQQPQVDPRLLDAASRAVGRWGWQGATLERIAGEAGLSRVTLHRRGISKESILAAMVRRAVEDYRAALWPALTGPGSGRERLQQALEAVLEVAEAHLPALLALQSGPESPLHQPGTEELLADGPFTDPLERLLRDGADDGSLRRMDPVETATVLFNMAGWTYVHLRTGHRWRPQRAKQAILELALRGVAPTSTSSPEAQP
jgi:AcrR family transcriptional regulator